MGHPAGTIDAVARSDDPGVAYEVSIRLSDGRDADIDSPQASPRRR